MVNIVQSSYDFIIENFDNIFLVFLFLIIGFVYIVMNNITFEDKPAQTKTTMIATYETMENMESGSESLSGPRIQTNECARLDGDNEKLEKYCKSLHPSLCKYKECCILGKSPNSESMKCVAGNETGPIYQNDDKGNPVNFDYYYYKGACTGASCPEED